MKSLRVGYDGKEFQLTELHSGMAPMTPLLCSYCSLKKTSIASCCFVCLFLETTAVAIEFGLIPRHHDPIPQSPIFERMNTTFTYGGFTGSAAPVSLGNVQNTTRFSAPAAWGDLRILDMPVKFPGSEYRIPECVAHFREVFEKVVAFERAVNPRTDEFFAYVRNPRPLPLLPPRGEHLLT